VTAWNQATSEISRSSRISTTASRRWRTASSITGALQAREMEAQSRRDGPGAERGITIKAHPSACTTLPRTASKYVLNLIDTPARRLLVRMTDRSPRARARCSSWTPRKGRGADAGERLPGVENTSRSSRSHKIDLPSAQPEEARRRSPISSARRRPCDPRQRQGGHGVPEVLEAIVHRLPRRPATPTRRSKR